MSKNNKKKVPNSHTRYTILQGKPVFKAEQGASCEVLETGDVYVYSMPYGWVKMADIPLVEETTTTATGKASAPKKRRPRKKKIAETPSTPE